MKTKEEIESILRSRTSFVLPKQSKYPLKWDLRFMETAKVISTWSRDPSSKIGAVIVGNNKQIISQGFNGFPRGISDYPERYDDREFKYKHVVHAEMNAIYNAIANGANPEGATIYVSGLPVCHECAKGIIQVGISRVVMNTRPEGRWAESGELSLSMFSEVSIDFCFI